MADAAEKGISVEGEDYTQDGTVDLKGRPVLRSQGGRWTACSFIIVYEIFERMAYYSIASNLVLYLTEELHQGTVTASNNVTNWVGTVWLTPILGAYLADAHFGRYRTLVTSSAIYLGGMVLLTLAVSLKSLRPPNCDQLLKGNYGCEKQTSRLQLGVFYAALYIVAVGNGGTTGNISTMGADQFDDFEPTEKKQKLSFFNWWMFIIFLGTLFANTVLVYIQDNVGWAAGYGLPTAGLFVSINIFLLGTRYYRHKDPSGSPFTRIARVLVAAGRKSRLSLPNKSVELHELSSEYYAKNGKYKIEHSNALRFLDRAAVKMDNATPWVLCTITEVEQTKQMIKMLPILITNIMPSAMFAQINTLFINQGDTMDRRMGPHFNIPPASLAAFVTIFMLTSLFFYNRYLVPTIKRYTKNPRGFTLLQRMGIGFVIYVILMLTASFTERHRLQVARDHGLQDRKETVPLTIFFLLPQLALMGIADTFVGAAKMEFFYDQSPEGMKSLGTSYSTTSFALGNFLSSFLLSTTEKVTSREGNSGWIQNNLNSSHLDYYYAFRAVLNATNLMILLLAAKYFTYNTDVVETEIELRKTSGEDINRIQEGKK